MSASAKELSALPRWLAVSENQGIDQSAAAVERLHTAKIAAIAAFAVVLVGMFVAYRVTNRRIQRDADEATLEAAFRELESGARPSNGFHEERER